MNTQGTEKYLKIKNILIICYTLICTILVQMKIQLVGDSLSSHRPR